MLSVQSAAPPARQRILDTAYELFSRRGIRAVGVNEVVERAGVAKATLYRHFPTKEALVLAFLRQREERWTRDRVEAEARTRGRTADERLLAIFDVFHDWFQEEAFDGCSFINVLLELGTQDNTAGPASVVHLENIRDIIRSFAEEAGLRDVDDFARSWHILMKGSIISAAEGDLQAARRAREMGRLVLDSYRR